MEVLWVMGSQIKALYTHAHQCAPQKIVHHDLLCFFLEGDRIRRRGESQPHQDHREPKPRCMLHRGFLRSPRPCCCSVTPLKSRRSYLIGFFLLLVYRWGYNKNEFNWSRTCWLRI